MYLKNKYLVIIFISLINIFQAQTKASRKHLLEGNNKYLAESYKDAAANYLNSIQDGEDSYRSNYNLGNAMYKLKKYDDALIQYEKSLQLAANMSEKANALFNMGNSYFQKGEYERAAEAFKNILKLNPKDDKARYNYTMSKQKVKEAQQKQEEQNSKDQDKNQGDKEDKTDNSTDKKDKDNSVNHKETQPNKNEKNSINNQKSQADTNNANLSDASNQHYENILGAMEEQEKRAHQKIINKRANSNQGQSSKDW